MCYKTNDLYESTINCDSLDEFKQEILILTVQHREEWKNKIQEIIIQNYSGSKSAFANTCGVSRQAVMKWCNGSIPQNRQTYIKIGFAAHYNLDEMNHFLKRYGKTPELYAKSLEDSICIFVLTSSVIEKTYESYLKILKEFEDLLNKFPYPPDNSANETLDILNSLLSVETITELRSFIVQHIATYKTAYSKFYAYVKIYLAKNLKASESHSINYYANGHTWSPSLRKCIYDIKNNTWFPTRSKTITLGVCLNMDIDQINEMLTLAHMEPLYAKNPLECIIIYAIEDAALNDSLIMGNQDSYYYIQSIIHKLGLDQEIYFSNDLSPLGAGDSYDL